MMCEKVPNNSKIDQIFSRWRFLGNILPNTSYLHDSCKVKVFNSIFWSNNSVQTIPDNLLWQQQRWGDIPVSCSSFIRFLPCYNSHFVENNTERRMEDNYHRSRQWSSNSKEVTGTSFDNWWIHAMIIIWLSKAYCCLENQWNQLFVSCHKQTLSSCC